MLAATTTTQTLPVLLNHAFTHTLLSSTRRFHGLSQSCRQDTTFVLLQFVVTILKRNLSSSQCPLLSQRRTAKMEHPIRNIELIKTFATAFVIWIVVMGFWVMDAVQQASTITMLVALINAVGAYIQNRQTTPLAAPEANEATPLVRGDTRQPTPVQIRSLAKR